MIPALGRKRQADLCGFEASLVYKVSSRKEKQINKQTVPGLQLSSNLLIRAHLYEEEMLFS